MKHLMDFVFLAIAVDVTVGTSVWTKQVLRARLGLIGIYIVSGLGLWMVQRWLLIPMELEDLSAQVYVFLALGLFGATRLTSGTRLWPNTVHIQQQLPGAIGVLILLGVPLFAEAGRLPWMEYLLASAAAALGWLSISYVIATLGEQLRFETVPRPFRGRGGQLIVVSLLYWAMMGFFNVHVI